MANEQTTRDINAAKQSLSDAMKAEHLRLVKEHIAAYHTKRLAAKSDVFARNAKTAKLIADEFQKAGMDFKNVNAMLQKNALDLSENQRRPSQSSVAAPALTNPTLEAYRRLGPPGGVSAPSGGTAPLPAPAGVIRMAPYDFADTQFIPSDPNTAFPGSFTFADANIDGGMRFFMDTPLSAPVPSNITAGALVGILVPPALTQSSLFGILTATMSGTVVQMSAHAGCNFSGAANSEGSIGRIIATVDPNTGLIQQPVTSNYSEQYYLDVAFGQSNSFFEDTTPFSVQFSFVTDSLLWFEIYLWFWGVIQASGAQGPWASFASGFGQLVLESIALTFQPINFSGV
jgi:hypothetical protein